MGSCCSAKPGQVQRGDLDGTLGVEPAPGQIADDVGGSVIRTPTHFLCKDEGRNGLIKACVFNI